MLQGNGDHFDRLEHKHGYVEVEVSNASTFEHPSRLGQKNYQTTFLSPINPK